MLKRTFLPVFLLVLILTPCVFPICPSESREIRMAAVVSENKGGIFVLQVEVKPGSGAVYTSINPRIGFSTQDSEQKAVEYAVENSGVGKNECDFFFSMTGDFGSNKIDGPSAGGAMSIAVKAALTNRSIREDVVMTGTISQDGDVGTVGGIIEKAVAARDSGAKYMLVPKMMLHEALLLSTVSSQNGFQAIEVTNFSAAERILFSDHSENFSSDFIPKSDGMPLNLTEQQYNSDTARFSIVATRLVNDLDEQVKSTLSASKNNTNSVASEKYFSSEISKYKKQISMGYPFTAANAAFLLSVDAEYLKVSESDLDINGSISVVSDCISSLSVPKKTKENLPWAIGADLRRIWAENKLNDTISARSDTEVYSTLRNLLLSYGWCGISRELAMQADDIGGEEVNEFSLSTLADEKLSEADAALTSSDFLNGDAYDHLQNGLNAYDRGNFGAAIYEATYALSMQAVADEAEGSNISSMVERLADEKRESVWGKIYNGQGLYLNAAAKEGLASPGDAYRILSYSKALDASSREIDSAVANQSGEWIMVKSPVASMPGAKRVIIYSQQAMASLSLFGCVFFLAVVVFYRMVKNKSADW